MRAPFTHSGVRTLDLLMRRGKVVICSLGQVVVNAYIAICAAAHPERL